MSNQDKAKSALQQTSFGKGGSIPGQDPLEPMDMNIPLDAIRPFEDNPRITDNAKFEEIKDSIYKTRLRDRLVITRRPGEQQYFLAEGGKTRWLALTQLAKKHPEDARFQSIHCTFIPFPGEATLLITHLAENDQRSNLKFYERALGVMKAKAVLEQEHDRTLNQKDLVELLDEQGYKVNHNQIGYMEFAVQVIGDNLHDAFRAGLGRPAVAEIKKFLSAWTRWWAFRECGTQEMGIEVFGQILHKNDAPDFEVSELRKKLDEEGRMYVDATVMKVSCEIGSFLNESGCARDPGETYREGQEVIEQTKARAEAEEAQQSALKKTPPPSSEEDIGEDDGDFELTGNPEPSLDDEEEQDDDVPHEVGADSPEVYRLNHTPPDNPPAFAPQHRSDVTPAPLAPKAPAKQPSDDKTLRGTMYTHALKLCSHYGMQSLLEPCANSARGLGFLIDFPTSLDNPGALPPEGHAVWWFLATLSEQFFTWPERTLEAMPQAWRPKPIAYAFKDSDRAERLSAYIEQNTQPLFGPALAPALFSGATAVGQRDYKDVQVLISTYHELTSQNSDVWELGL